MSINLKQSILVGLVLVIGVIVFFTSGPTKKNPDINKLKVTASFYPLAFLAERVGGEHVTVTNLTPAGAEPHDFEPNTKDIAMLESQDIILLNGGGLEGYVDQIKENIDPKHTQLILVGEPLMSNPKDPHVWIDPVLYMKELEAITAAFIKQDSEHASEYISNSKVLRSELEGLNKEFIRATTNCSTRNIVTSHNAFAYLANRYGLKQIALVGLSPEEEPSARMLADVTAFVKKNNIGYIFFEELASPAISQTIATETGAGTLMLNPLEGLVKEEEAQGKTYISIQQENMKNLEIALSCTK